MGKGSTKYQLLKDDSDHAVKQIELKNKEINLLRASRRASIHEYRQLSNERAKLKEEVGFLKDDVQVRDERINELEKELNELKNGLFQEVVIAVQMSNESYLGTFGEVQTINMALTADSEESMKMTLKNRFIDGTYQFIKVKKTYEVI